MTKQESCIHRYGSGKSAIVFEPLSKWRGVFPKKIKGYCTLCDKPLEFTEEEYNKIKEMG